VKLLLPVRGAVQAVKLLLPLLLRLLLLLLLLLLPLASADFC